MILLLLVVENDPNSRVVEKNLLKISFQDLCSKILFLLAIIRVTL